MSSQPTLTCRSCGRVRIVRPDGRGFPPDIAKRALTKACRADGCACDPVYRAGLSSDLAALLRRGQR